MKKKFRKTLEVTLFLLVIAGLSVVYNYPDTLGKPPQSIHNWRQSDGASLALCYYQEGMHFFKPQTQLLNSDDFTTGYSSPSEIPVLYYFVAFLYKIFGYHEFIFRLVNLLFFFLGLFYLYKLAMLVIGNFFYSIIVVILVFSSPLLVYYANNFMPNTTALSFSFAGWYYFYLFYINKQNKSFYLSVLFFGMAGAMKITELTGPIIILALMLADKARLLKLGLSEGPSFRGKILTLLTVFFIVGSWIIYAKFYNTHHTSAQFSTYTFPFWKLNSEDIAYIFHNMYILWFNDYFFPATLYFVIGCILIMVFKYRRSDQIMTFSSLMLVIALLAFSALWFEALGHHDYFFIGFYVLPAFAFINFFLIIKNIHYHKLLQWIIQTVFILVAVVNVIHARERHQIRYNSWMNDYPEMKDVYTVRSVLSTVGISKGDTVIFYPSRNVRPLYLMNLKGWVIYDHNEVTDEVEHRDSVHMSAFVKRGADYFITNNIKSATSFKPFEPYMNDLVVTYNSVYVFRLSPKNMNVRPADDLLQGIH